MGIIDRLDTGPELLSHIERNLAYFQANYLMIALLILAFALFMHPPWLMAVSIVSFVWAIYLSRGGLDPDWKPVVGGIEWASSHRLTILYTASLALVFMVFGEALLVLVGAIATLSAMHAAFHPDPCKAALQMAALRAAVAAADSAERPPEREGVNTA